MVFMSLLIDMRNPEWMTDVSLKALVSSSLPNVNIVCGPPELTMPEIIMATFTNTFDTSILQYLPNLRLVQKVGAGVDSILADPKFPTSIRVSRMSSGKQSLEMAEYCLAEVLAYQRNIRFYQKNQIQKDWQQYAPLCIKNLHIGVLGLGQIGRKVAQLFLKYGFKVSGWSRSSKNIKGLKSYTGHDGLETMLSHSDYVIGILPSTRETDNLIDAEMLRNFKSSAIFINIGRGNLVVDNDLVDALNTGVLKAATLDVFRQEPLPLDHPFWDHSKIAITPHVSGWNVDDTIMDIAQNYLRLLNNERLLHEVDRDLGY